MAKRTYHERRVKGGSGRPFSTLRAPTYEPTLEEIAEACERIRATWDATELRRRAGTMLTPRVTYDPIDGVAAGMEDGR